MKGLTDKELIELIKQDDHKAFGALYKRYHQFLLSCGKKMMPNDKQTAYDLANDIFADLWKRRLTLNITGEIGALLYVTLKNRIYNISKHRKIELRHHTFMLKGENFVGNADHLIRHKQLSECIQLELNKMPPTIKTIMDLRINSMMGRNEISKYLNMPMNTVKTNIYRGLVFLKRVLKPYQD